MTSVDTMECRKVVVRETACKTILNRSGISDYCLNCYTGCARGCVYCYARFMQRFHPHPEPWGQFVDVKVNAVEVLERQLRRARRGEVFVSSACDGWQPIEAERGLTATIGIAGNKLLAKIASDFQKPDGLTFISEAEKVSFLRPLPVRVLYGVGQVTEQVLHQAGLRTVGDLRTLVGWFGSKLKQFAFGQDDRPLEVGEEVKSISSEETFLYDTDDRKILRSVCDSRPRKSQSS